MQGIGVGKMSGAGSMDEGGRGEYLTGMEQGLDSPFDYFSTTCLRYIFATLLKVCDNIYLFYLTLDDEYEWP